jgi:hypothetical protein
MCLAFLPLKIAQRFNAGEPRVIRMLKSRSGTKGAPPNKHRSVVPRGTLDSFAHVAQSGSRRTGLLSEEEDAKQVPAQRAVPTNNAGGL